jgi:hypothetical protein
MSSTTTVKKKDDGTSIGDAIFKSSFNVEDKILIDPNNKLQKSLLVAKRLSTEEDEMKEQIKKLKETTDFKPKKRIESLDAIAGLKYNLGRNYKDIYGKTKIISDRDLALFKKNNKKISKIYIPNLHRSVYNIDAANSKPNRGRGDSPYDQLAQKIQKIDIKTPEGGAFKKGADTFVAGVSFIVKPVLKVLATRVMQVTFTAVAGTTGIPGVVVGATGWLIVGMGDYYQRVNADPLADDYDRRWQAVLSAGCGYMLLHMPLRTSLPGLAGGAVASYVSVYLGTATQGLVKLAYPGFVEGIFIFDQKNNYDIKTAFIEGDDTYDIFDLWKAILKVQYEEQYEEKWSRGIKGYVIPKFVRTFFRGSTEKIDYVVGKLSKEFSETLFGNVEKFASGISGGRVASVGRGFATTLRTSTDAFISFGSFSNQLRMGFMGGLGIPVIIAATCLDAISRILFTIHDNFGVAAAILTAVVWVPLLSLWVDTQFGGELTSTSVGWLSTLLGATLDIVLTRDFFSEVFRETAMPVASGFLSNYMKNHLDSFVGMAIVSAGLSTVTTFDITNTTVWIPIVLSTIPLLAPYMAPKNVIDRYNNMRASTLQGIESQLYEFYYRSGLLDLVDSLETRTDDIPFLHMGLEQALTMYVVDGLVVESINSGIMNIYDMSVDRGIDYINKESVIQLEPITPKAAQAQIIALEKANADLETNVGTANTEKTTAKKALYDLHDELKVIDKSNIDAISKKREQINSKQQEIFDLDRDIKRMNEDNIINDKIMKVINDAVTKALEESGQGNIEDLLPKNEAIIKFEPVYKRRGIINEGINMWLDAHYWWRKDTTAPQILKDYTEKMDQITSEGIGEQLENNVDDLKGQVGDAETKPSIETLLTPGDLSLETLNNMKENYNQEEVNKARENLKAEFDDEEKRDRFCNNSANSGCADISVIEDAFKDKIKDVSARAVAIDELANTLEQNIMAAGLDKLGIVAVREFNSSINLTKEQRIKYAGVIREAGNVKLITQYARAAARQVNIRVGTVGINFTDGTMFIDSELKRRNEQLDLFEDAQNGNGVLYYDEKTDTYILSRPDESPESGDSGSDPVPVDIEAINGLINTKVREIYDLNYNRIVAELGGTSTDVETDLNVLDKLDRNIRLKMAGFQTELKGSVNVLKAHMEGFLVRERKIMALSDIRTKPFEFIFNSAWGVSTFNYSPFELGMFAVLGWNQLLGTPAIMTYMALRGINDARIPEDWIPYKDSWPTLFVKTITRARGIRAVQLTWPVLKLVSGGWDFKFTSLFNRETKDEAERKKIAAMKNDLLLYKARIFNTGKSKVKLSKQKELVESAPDGEDKDLVMGLIELELDLIEKYREKAAEDFGKRIYQAQVDARGDAGGETTKQREAEQELAYQQAFDMATQVDLDFAFAYSLDIDIDIDITMAYQYDSPPAEEGDGEAKARGDKPRPPEPEDNVEPSGYRVLTKSPLGVNLKDKTGKLDDIIPKEVQDIWRRMTADFAEQAGGSEDAKQFFESNMLWLGMYAEPADALREIKVDTNMMIAMLRKVQFERIPDRALASDEFNDIINREREAQIQFYEAMEGDQFDINFLKKENWREKQYNPRPNRTSPLEGERWVTRSILAQEYYQNPEKYESIRNDPKVQWEGYNENSRRVVYYEKWFDAYGVGSGDAMRVKDETLLQIVNYEKEEGDKFTSVAQYYEALDDPSQSERTAVKWNNIYLLDLFSENRPGMDSNYVPILREHEKEVMNYDFDKALNDAKNSLKADLQAIDQRRLEGGLRVDDELSGIVDGLLRFENFITDITPRGYEVIGEVLDYKVKINALAADQGAEKVGADIIGSGAIGGAVGGAYKRFKRGDVIGVGLAAAKGAVLGVGSALVYHAGYSKGEVRVNNAVKDDGTLEEVFLPDEYPEDFANPPIENYEPGLFGYIEPQAWGERRAFNQILLGHELLAEEGIRVGAGAPVGVIRDVGERGDVPTAVNELSAWESAADKFNELQLYLYNNADRAEKEKNFERDVGEYKSDWLVNYELAEKISDDYAKKDELNLAKFRKNEVMNANPETVIDEAHVLGQRNLVKNFLANKYFDRFVKKENLRPELQQYAEF